ncbi:Rhodanese-like domain-containing protein [Corynascus novoguineensis]|uniref:Rhodanese-like domain-containing protein n=1 Tax=Corynascus novoguineensis TaxID=1126955 RepID=A0AAN7HI68_9PEZI|nr:Rhodanese-like domain-containing protein [Corynascus novoguineensis]
MSFVPTILRLTRFSLPRACSAKMSAPQPEPTTTVAPTPPWHAAYPVPRKAEPQGATREEVLAMLKTQLKDEHDGSRDFLLIDLRRIDHEGGTIRGSINLPAQSLYPTIPTLYSVLKAAGVRKVVWYCSSSRGRGTRAAGWFSHYLSGQGDNDMQSLVLVDGIKGWATAGPEYTEWMDEYDESVWLKS